MKRLLATAFCGWILWTFASNESSFYWFPSDGYQSYDTCRAAMEVRYTHQWKKEEKGEAAKNSRTFSCFPSDFDPREEKAGKR